MTKSAVKPRILIVDDDVPVGRALKKVIERSFKCQVCFPRSVEAMQDSVLNEAFDSVLVDANLSHWPRPFRVFGREVRDGIDFVRAYCEFQEKSLVVLFGPANLPYQPQVQLRIRKLSRCNLKIMESPLPPGQREIEKAIDVLQPKIEEELRPQIEETAIIHETNPIFQPLSAYEGLPGEEKCLRQRLLYKRACKWIGKWVNFNLHEAGDSSWTVVCGGNFQKDFYGELLNGRRAASEVRIRERYPLRSELKGLAEAERTNPFIFWNTWDTAILSKQFSDERLQKIPDAFQDDFGIAVASSCAKAYNDGAEKQALAWCQRLSPIGQLDTIKTIFRSLNGDRARSIHNFSRRCKKARLNRIIDIYKARVETTSEKENTAVVELTNLSGDDNFTAPFELAKLKNKGIKEAGQVFEYAVYADLLDHAFGEIELTE